MRTRSSKVSNSISKTVLQLATVIEKADAIFVGAGAGLSTSAGLTYSGARFEKHFSDFEEAYGFHDMYSGGFYPYATKEEYWGYWARYIAYNRYENKPLKVYSDLLKVLENKDYFVLTTNVDHQFQLAGFDKKRLFYTQGDYGLFQCSVPCRQETWSNKETVYSMLQAQSKAHEEGGNSMVVPSELIPVCPHCGAPAVMNLRSDETFVEDEGWHVAAQRYHDFVRRNKDARVVLLELGVGFNTPVIIKYPFWQMTYANKKATFASVNQIEPLVPHEIKLQSLLVKEDIGNVLEQLIELQRTGRVA